MNTGAAAGSAGRGGGTASFDAIIFCKMPGDMLSLEPGILPGLSKKLSMVLIIGQERQKLSRAVIFPGLIE